MTKTRTLTAVGSLLLVSLLGACTEKYIRQKEADDRLIGSLNTDLRAKSEELDEAQAVAASFRQRAEDAERRLQDAVKDRDTFKQQIDELSRKPQPKTQPSEVARIRSRLGGDAEVDLVDGRPRITLSSEVTFSSGKADLSKRGQTILKKLAALLKSDYPGKKIWVCGHTDNEPIRKSNFISNLHLSVARALSAIQFLEETCKVAEKNLICAGYGMWAPRFSNKTAEGRSKNRRVEFIVSK